jgi:putative transposase
LKGKKIFGKVKGKRTRKYGCCSTPESSVGVIDSQSVKSMPETKGLEVGFEGGKLVRGRKRSIVVDTMGYVICVLVHAANIYGCGATHQNL